MNLKTIINRVLKMLMVATIVVSNWTGSTIFVKALGTLPNGPRFEYDLHEGIMIQCENYSDGRAWFEAICLSSSSQLIFDDGVNQVSISLNGRATLNSMEGEVYGVNVFPQTLYDAGVTPGTYDVTLMMDEYPSVTVSNIKITYGSNVNTNIEYQLLKSFEIVNFTKNVASGTTFEIKYELNGDVDANLQMVYYMPNEEMFLEVGKEFKVEEDWKYKAEDIPFVYMSVSANVDGYYVGNIYSHLTKDEIMDKYGYEINDKIYPIDDYSITLTDANVDKDGPVFNNVVISQEKNYVDINFELVDMVGIYSFNAYFKNVNNGNEFNLYFEKPEQLITAGTHTLSTNIRDVFEWAEKGTYYLSKIEAWDKVGNYAENNFTDPTKNTVAISAENHPLYNATSKDVVFTTQFVDGEIYFRRDKDMHDGGYFVEVQVEDCRKNLVAFAWFDLNRNMFNTDKVADLTYTTTLNVRLDSATVKTLDVSIPVHIVDPIGTIVEYDHEAEIILDYEEYKANKQGVQISRIRPYYVQLDTGEYIIDYAKVDGLGVGSDGNNSMFGGRYAYNPLYRTANADDDTGYIEDTIYVYLIDDNGNLVGEAGNVLLASTKRKEITLSDVSLPISMKTKEGTIPSYAVIDAKAISTIDALKDKEYVAYDMNIAADGIKVQPVGDMEVTINLPANLQNQEVDVYYVDANGALQLVDTVTATSSVTFTTNHFSTYAVAAKKQSSSNTGFVGDVDSPIQSFEIEGFQSKFKSGSSFNVNYTLKDGVRPDAAYIDMIFLADNGEEFGASVWDNQIQFDEMWKYKAENYQFVYLSMRYYDAADNEYYAYYSPYTKEKAMEMLPYLYVSENAKWYVYNFDYSFTYTDVNIDKTAPSLENFTVSRDKDYIDVSFTSDENQSGIASIYLEFDNGYGFSVYAEKVDGIYKGSYSLMNDYQYYLKPENEGTYTLKEVALYDAVYNSTSIIPSKPFTLDLLCAENPLANLTEEDYSFETWYPDGKLYARKDVDLDSYMGAVFLNVKDSRNEIITLGFDIVDVASYDNSAEKTYTVPYTFVYEINGKQVRVEHDFELVVQDTVGTIIETEYAQEFIRSYEDYKENGLLMMQMRTLVPILVKLDTGEVIVDYVKPGAGGSFAGEDTTGAAYIEEGADCYYYPKYRRENDDNGYMIQSVRYYLIDKDGNLVDYDGSVRVPYAERDTWKYNTSFEELKVSALEGTIPSYTKVNAITVNNLDQFANTDYVAYDITLVADEQEVQPVGTVDVTLDLPSELQGKEVEVYYVDDNGVSSKVDNYTTSEDGTSVTFTTDHFSTYAVVAKELVVKNGICADENGKLWYYVDNVKTYGGLMYIDGYYYYARTSGEIVANRTYWITKTNDLLPEANYTFDAEGKMVNAPVEEPEVPVVLNGIQADSTGKLWYYENDVKTYGGLMYIDGYYYYARTSGEIVVNRSYWITKTNDLLPQSTYTFDENGKIDF